MSVFTSEPAGRSANPGGTACANVVLTLVRGGRDRQRRMPSPFRGSPPRSASGALRLVAVDGRRTRPPRSRPRLFSGGAD